MSKNNLKVRSINTPWLYAMIASLLLLIAMITIIVIDWAPAIIFTNISLGMAYAIAVWAVTLVSFGCFCLSASIFVVDLL